jgi:hypothetical protein
MIVNDETTEHLNRDKPAWPLGKPPGRFQIAAIPNSPEIISLLTQNYCTSVKGDNCYEVVNKKGDVIQLPFGSALEDWTAAVHQVASYCD